MYPGSEVIPLGRKTVFKKLPLSLALVSWCHGFLEGDVCRPKFPTALPVSAVTAAGKLQGLQPGRVEAGGWWLCCSAW